ncbi:hypothetical protein O181_086470 [Austropuccinia psidii MF-1]|uniref:Uncharacterized protein n=1 Tax=Austropuccinia psidii MF-1 TaxID=1389203 RepID=A0A9Q3FZB7_9BASI|nr:hypothetical protein [Austropuccinia psidii MF-1]
MIITKGWNPPRKLRLLEVRANRIRENKDTIQAIEEQLTQKGHIQIPSGSQVVGQISSPAASYHSEKNRSVAKSHHSSHSQEGSRRRQGHKGKNKTSFHQRQRESDPMIQKLLELVKEVHKSQNDALWLQISHYAEKTQKQLEEAEESHERMKKLTASMDKVVKTLQKGHAQLRKAFEETNKILNIVFEEQHHSRRYRDCLDQDINRLFNVYHNMKPQPQGHVMDNPYYQHEIKTDAIWLIGKISITVPGWR